MKEEKNNTINAAFKEDVSPADFYATIDRLSKEIEGKSWIISNVYDLQKTLKNFGETVLPVHVFSLCHPSHSSRILKKDTERIISSMMPCRISVYEKSDGKTYVSRMNPAMLASTYGGLIEKVMTESANEVEEIIKKALHLDY